MLGQPLDHVESSLLIVITTYHLSSCSSNGMRGMNRCVRSMRWLMDSLVCPSKDGGGDRGGPAGAAGSPSGAVERRGVNLRSQLGGSHVSEEDYQAGSHEDGGRPGWGGRPPPAYRSPAHPPAPRPPPGRDTRAEDVCGH